MAGIYIHIPYCRAACSYCDFHFSTKLDTQNPMLEAIVKEIFLQQLFFKPKDIITSVYFGGGTPSVVSFGFIEKILDTLRSVFGKQMAKDLELSMEINPEDVDSASVKCWSKAGFNRFSLGFQALQDDILIDMKRGHTAKESIQALRLMQEVGLSNISADLMFNVPKMNINDLKYNVLTLISMGVPHVSIYGLTVEQNTLLHHQVLKKTVKMPSDTNYKSQFNKIHSWLTSEGYEHYELSNYAKKGYHSQHNSSYWHGAKYLGIGPGAHSYNGAQRFSNIANNQLYIKYLKEEKWNEIQSIETLSTGEIYHEYIITRLRTLAGIDQTEMKNQLGDYYLTLLVETIHEKGLEHKFYLSKDTISLKPEFWIVMDAVFLELFLAE